MKKNVRWKEWNQGKVEVKEIKSRFMSSRV